MAKAKQIRKALKKEFAPLRKALESIEIRLKAIEKELAPKRSKPAAKKPATVTAKSAG
jgi:hypothetical protein